MAVQTVMSTPQLALGVKLRDDARFDNFHGQRNAEAALHLQALCREQTPVMVLCGDRDTGKSHLLQAACHETELQGQAAICVSMPELARFGPEALEGLEHAALVCLDDVDHITGQAQWEEAVFHLFNRVLDQGHRVLMSLSNTPAAIAFGLDDLASRLRHGVLIQLGVYRDNDRLRILSARAEQRGLQMGDEVSTFIMRRAPRKLAELLAILDRLDENSLQAQRRLTVPFVKSVMDW